MPVTSLHVPEVAALLLYWQQQQHWLTCWHGLQGQGPKPHAPKAAASAASTLQGHVERLQQQRALLTRLALGCMQAAKQHCWKHQQTLQERRMQQVQALLA